MRQSRPQVLMLYVGRLHKQRRRDQSSDTRLLRGASRPGSAQVCRGEISSVQSFIVISPCDPPTALKTRTFSFA